MGFFKLIAQYFIVNNKQWINALFLAITVAINVGLNLLFVRYFGIIGAAISTSISHFVCGVLFIAVFAKTTNSRVIDLLLVKKEDFGLVTQLFHKGDNSNEK